MSKGVTLVPILLLGFAVTLSVVTLWTSPSFEEEQMRRKASIQQQRGRNPYQRSMQRQNTQQQLRESVDLGNGGGVGNQEDPSRGVGSQGPTETLKYAFQTDNGELLQAIPIVGASRYYRMLLVRESEASSGSIEVNKPPLTMGNSEHAMPALKSTKTTPTSSTPSTSGEDPPTVQSSSADASGEADRTGSVRMGLSIQAAVRDAHDYRFVFMGCRLGVMAVLLLVLVVRHYMNASSSDDGRARGRSYEDDDSDVSAYSTGPVYYSNSPADVGYGTVAFFRCDDSFEKFDL